MPEELREILTARTLGVSLAELRAMPWEDVETALAYERGRQIAALARQPGAGNRESGTGDERQRPGTIPWRS